MSGDKQEAEKHFPEELLDDLNLVIKKESILKKLENGSYDTIKLSNGLNYRLVFLTVDFETIKFIFENLEFEGEYFNLPLTRRGNNPEDINVATWKTFCRNCKSTMIFLINI